MRTPRFRVLQDGPGEARWNMSVDEALLLESGRTGPALRLYGWRAAIGGFIATIGYGIAIYALSVGAMAHVAALRETSVLFATVIGTKLLGEQFGAKRVAAAGMIVAGLVLMNLRL